MEPIFGTFGIFGIIVSIFLPPEILLSSQQKEKRVKFERFGRTSK
jgi:hypothetical protein